MSFLSSFPGPDYPYAHRWGARVATVMLTIPFIPVAYGVGYAVDWSLDEDPHGGGVFTVTLFLGLLCSMWFGQWLKGFRQ